MEYDERKEAAAFEEIKRNLITLLSVDFEGIALEKRVNAILFSTQVILRTHNFHIHKHIPTMSDIMGGYGP